MAKTSQQIEQEFIDDLKTSTGKDLKAWMNEITKQNFGKRNDLIQWLKDKQGFGHMHASLLAGIHVNGGNPVYANDDVLLENQFEKFPDMKPLYNTFIQAIHKWDPEVDVVVKKTYVSLTKKREFAAINIRKGELRIGMDLGDQPFTDQIEKSKLTGPMPRISHMMIIRQEKEIDKAFLHLLETADQRVNK